MQLKYITATIINSEWYANDEDCYNGMFKYMQPMYATIWPLHSKKLFKQVKTHIAFLHRN